MSSTQIDCNNSPLIDLMKMAISKVQGLNPIHLIKKT